MLSGKLWPAHPKPFPDEILSSWIVRVAEANAVKLQTLCWMLFGNERSPWNRDIDRSAPKWLLKAICEHTGTNYWDGFHTTLVVYRNRLYPRRQYSGQLRWVLPVRSDGMRRHGCAMQFCPECLAGDLVPYFRKYWRLAMFTFCPIHDAQLHDACPACGQPVMYYRRDFGKELWDAGPICACHACGFDFRQSERVVPVFSSPEIESLFREMLHSLLLPPSKDGRFDLGFFAVLHQMTRIMVMRQNADRLRCHVAGCIGCDAPPMALGRISVEQRTRQERHHLLSLGLWLLGDMGPRLSDAWVAKAVRYNLMLRDFNEGPGWYRPLVARFSDWRADLK